MSWEGIRRKLKFLFFRKRSEADLAGELAMHLEFQMQKHMAAGMSEAEALRRARVEFGATESAREECRETDGWSLLDAFGRNTRYAFRSLRRSPGFAAIAILILATGIGVNLAVFHVFNALLLRPLQVRNANELVRIALVRREGDLGDLPSTFLDTLQTVPDYQGLCGFDTVYSGAEIGSSVTSVGMLGFSDDCFSTLGINVQLGRTLTQQDDNPGAEPAAVITDAFWRKQFNSRRSVLGEQVLIEGRAYTVVGVAEPQFKGLLLGFPAGIVIPLKQEHWDALPNGRRPVYWWVNILARRAPGVSENLAFARLKVRSSYLLENSVPPNFNAARRKAYLSGKVTLVPAKTGIDYFLRRRFGSYIYAAAGICATLLLIGCVNLANLLLARSAKRRREVAVRFALGAKRSQVAWLFASETFLLLGAGAVLGLLLARVLDASFMAAGDRMFGNFDLLLAFDWRMAFFLIGALAAMAGAFVTISAWQANRLQNSEEWKAGGRGVVGHDSTPQKVLIASQIALTLAMVAVSGLLSASLKKFYGLDLGVQSRNVWDIMLSKRPGVKGHFETGPYYRDLLRQVKALPDVDSAIFADWIPFYASGEAEPVSPIDTGREQTGIQAAVLVNSAELTRTLGMKMITGDGFPSDERGIGEPAVVLSQSLAERFSKDPEKLIGHHVRIGLSSDYQRLRIVGVVSNAQTNLAHPENLAPFVAYIDIWQHPDRQQYPVLLIKTKDNSLNVDSLRKIVNARGREYVYRVRSLTEEKDGALMENRLLAYLSSAFSALAVLMAATGLFGLLSYQVANRTGEIGIRMALGAERSQIRWLVLRQVTSVILIGSGLGFVLTLAVGRAITGVLFGVAPYSPSLLAISCLVLLSTSLVAAWIPVRRATSIDPAAALRHE